MKKIKIKFVDFWPNFNEKDNLIYNILNKKYNVEICDDPDYVICSTFGAKHLKYNDKIKMLLIGENIAPNFDLYDYIIGFYDIKFKDRYLKYNILFDKSMIDLAIERKENKTTKFCCFVYSRNKLDQQRKYIFDKLSEYKRVDSGGRYLHNIDYKIGESKEDKVNFQKDYKFIIACENQSYPEYTTEKILEAFASGGIPIYWGDPQVDRIFNKKAFINCMEYDNLDEVKQKIIELDNDDQKYMEMQKQKVFNEKFDFEKETTKLEDFIYNIVDQDISKAKRVYLKKGFYIYEYYKKFYIVVILNDIFVKIKTFIKKILRR